MTIDINIMCVRQNSEIISYDEDLFYLERLNVLQTDGVIYQDNWFLYNSIIGIGYNLYLYETQDLTYNLVDYKKKKIIKPYAKHMLQDVKKPSNSVLEKSYCSVLFNERRQ